MSDITSGSVVKRFRTRHGAKLVRFGAVSGFNVLFGQTLLYAAQTIMEWSPVAANIFSVSVSAVPAYFLSRYWVWQKRGRNHFLREVLPFWTLAVLGFVLSTTAVWFVARQWDPHPLIINLTNLVAFGIVWTGKFIVLDRLLFKHEDLTDEPLDALVAKIIHDQND